MKPALLYLVPGCILPVIIAAWMRGEFQQLWEYSEEDTNETNTNNTDAKKQE